jgi:FkbM family methyltransferase
MGIARTFNMIRNIQNWNSYLLYKMGGKKQPTFTFVLKNGVQVTVPRKVIPEFKESVFEEVYFKYLPKNILEKNNPTVIDIGANVGFFSIFSASKLKQPKIVAFEPVKRNFEKLEKNTASSNQYVTIVNKAVNNTSEDIVLKFDGTGDITTSASLLENHSGNTEERVRATTLPDIFKDYQIEKLDLLKMDCEGAEYNILYNLPSEYFAKIDCISMETHLGKGEGENNKALADYLEKSGYNVKTKGEDFIWAWR